MPADYKEKAFESAIVHHLAMHGGYTHGDNCEYHSALISVAVTDRIDVRNIQCGGVA